MRDMNTMTWTKTDKKATPNLQKCTPVLRHSIPLRSDEKDETGFLRDETRRDVRDKAVLNVGSAN